MKSIAVTLFIVLFCSQLSAQVLLRYDLEAGKNYPSSLEVEQTIKQNIMGTEQNVDSKQLMEMDMQVDDVEDDLTNMSIMYTRIAMVQTTPMGEMKYDSDSLSAEDAPGALMGYAALVDNGFTITFDEKGKIQDVSGLDRMIENIIDNMNIEDPAQKAETLKIVKQQFDADALTAQMQNSFAIYPDEEINIGDTWDMNQAITTPFPMQITSTYTLTDYDDEYAYLAVDSKIKSDGESPMQNAGMTMNITLSGDQSGTMKVERKSGMIKESSIIQKASGTIDMTAPQQVSWPIELDTKVKVTGDF